MKAIQDKTLAEFIEDRYGGHGEAELQRFIQDVTKSSKINGLSIWGVRKWLYGQRGTPRRQYRVRIEAMAKKDRVRLSW